MTPIGHGLPIGESNAVRENVSARPITLSTSVAPQPGTGHPRASVSSPANVPRPGTPPRICRHRPAGWNRDFVQKANTVATGRFTGAPLRPGQATSTTVALRREGEAGFGRMVLVGDDHAERFRAAVRGTDGSVKAAVDLHARSLVSRAR